MAKRKFFKTVVTVEVLSEDFPVSSTDLGEIHEMITTGDCSGVVKITSAEELSPQHAARALVEQGSDPEFFDLHEDGSNVS